MAKKTIISRRNFTAGSLAGIALTAGATPSFAGAHAAFDGDNSVDAMKALVKLRGSTQNELIVWWLQGVLYGVVDRVPTKLWDLETVSFSRWDNLGDGSYEFVHTELSVKKDLKSGELLTSFDNPFTGETLTADYKVFQPIPLIVTADSARLAANAPMSPDFVHQVGPAAVSGDDIWVGQDMYATRNPAQPGGKPWRANDINIYSGKLSDVLNPSISSADAKMSYQGFYDWRPWLNMGDIEGNMLARLAGKKLRSAEEIPNSYLKLVEEVAPNYIESGPALIGL